jgi:hypothetical protein
MIYASQEERHRLVAEFIKAGVEKGERVRYLADTTPADAIRAWLEEMGLEVHPAEGRGAFAISSAEAAYCPQGSFDPEGMIARNLQSYRSAAEAGFTGARACGEMSWVLKRGPGYDRFLEYEALLNTVDTSFPHAGMCQYDARRFDGAALFDLLKLHPFMVAGGQIVRNPYYTKPEEFFAARGLPMPRSSQGDRERC